MLPVVQEFLRRYKFYKVCIVLSFGLLITLFVGCGSIVSGQGGQSQASPTPTSTSPQQMLNCGQVDTALNGQPLDRNSAMLDGNCFWQAFRKCQSATLIFKVHSLDTEAIHTFTIKNNNGTCSILDAVQHYILPNKLTSTTAYTCSGLVMQADGLHFIACDNTGNIHIPL